jgi:chromosome segregation ATPase
MSLQDDLKSLLNNDDFLAKIDVLDKQITQKESTVKRLQSDIKDLETKLSIASDETDSKIAELNDELESKSNELILSKRILSSVSDDVKREKKSLKIVQNDIGTQTAYLNNEQVKINEIVNKWNDQLRDFQEADNEVKVKRESVNRDIIRLEQHKTELETEIEQIDLKNAELDEQYQLKATGYRSTLSKLKDQIQDSEQALYELELKTKARIDIANSKEQSVVIRERALQQNEILISSREKKLNMKLGLLKLSIE